MVENDLGSLIKSLMTADEDENGVLSLDIDQQLGVISAFLYSEGRQ